LRLIQYTFFVFLYPIESSDCISHSLFYRAYSENRSELRKHIPTVFEDREDEEKRKLKILEFLRSLFGQVKVRILSLSPTSQPSSCLPLSHLPLIPLPFFPLFSFHPSPFSPQCRLWTGRLILNSGSGPEFLLSALHTGTASR
jgi:hypothetical protein